MKSIRSYGLHGATGLLMGIGFGFIILFFIGMFFGLPMVFIGNVVIFAIYGAYVGYIFGGEGISSRLAKLGAVSGVLSGLVGFFLSEVYFIPRSGLFDQFFFISFAGAGLFFGFPNLKKMVMMVLSSAIGAVLGAVIFFCGENVKFYLNNALMPGNIIFLILTLFFLLLSIGVAGASIAIGIYFTERTSYTKREIPRYLKVTRNAGIVLTLIILLISSLMTVSMERYASTSTNIYLSPGKQSITVYVPVLLDEKGNILDMYKNPQIVGDARAEIIETNHGKALKITGSGEMDIVNSQNHGMLSKTSEATEKFYNGFMLSMSNTTNFGNIRGSQTVSASVYSENDIREFNFYVMLDNGLGRTMSIHTEKPEKLVKGWQDVVLRADGVMYD